MTVNTNTIAITRHVYGKTVTYRVGVDGALSRPEAAALLRVSLRQIYRLVKTARLPIVHERGDVHIPISALLEYQARGSGTSRRTREHRSTMRAHGEATSRMSDDED